jgi:hypothetical protein
MNIVGKAASALGGIFLSALLIAALAPKATRGIAAALVQVTNTAANPVAASDAGYANEPFAWEGSGGPPGESTSFVVPSSTADGGTVQRLVIENVTAVCGFLSTPSPGIRLQALPIGSEFFAPFPDNPSGPGIQVLSQQTRLYVDPGTTVEVDAQSNTPRGDCSFSTFGHFILE